MKIKKRLLQTSGWHGKKPGYAKPGQRTAPAGVMIVTRNSYRHFACGIELISARRADR